MLFIAARRAGTHSDVAQISKWVPDRAVSCCPKHRGGRVRNDTFLCVFA